MQYIPPFEIIKSFLSLANFRGKLTATASYDDIQKMIGTLLSGIDVDEAWYLRQNPDIAEAIKAGVVKSAKEHFLHNGYFEGRRPGPIEVDETWYLAQYPEVAEAVKQGTMESAQRHFDEHGYKEGRLPRSL